jgi:tetratricopeptide (TPR) repeat protein
MTPERFEKVARLYRSAVELEPSQRSHYLAEACAADEALRAEVEALLSYDLRGNQLLDRPAFELAVHALDEQRTRALKGQQIGHCRLLSLLGKGGMGEVWLGQDTQLGRRVAVKLLPSTFTHDPERVRRFIQEARAASALNHPNIITIHEVGARSKGDVETHYLVTEYVEGETLRQRMSAAPQGQMNFSEALDIATQVAAALSVAHAAGIVHRDIKPENVMLRNDGLVKVLDFGLAKLTERPGAADDSGTTQQFLSTEPGIVMGTPRYMSPEQARGEKVDSRSDIFSFGVMLYEMVAGRPPFAGATPSEVIAAILRDEPLPLTAGASPPELQQIINRALQKNPEARYPTMLELLGDIKRLTTGRTDSADQVATIGRQQKLFGRLDRRQGVLITLAILVLVAVAAFFYFNRRPALTAKDTLLLADFINTTGDADFDGTLKQALAVQLEQTPFLNFFPEERVRETLRLMNRSPEERITREAGTEICQRQGLKALIIGAIAKFGSHYVLTLEAINGQNGEEIARQQTEAAGKEQVLRSLGQAATQLRAKLGESLASIQRFDTQLEQATTSSLDALKAFSLGAEKQRGGKFREAIPFYKRATELDANFALAYALLAGRYSDTEQPQLAAEAAAKAFALREHVTEREKFRVAVAYHDFVSGETDKAMEALELWKQTYPQDYYPRNYLIVSYRDTGQFEKSIEAAREVIQLYPNYASPRVGLGHSLFRAGRFDEAKAAYKSVIEQRRDTVGTHRFLYVIAVFQGVEETMRQELDWLNRNAPKNEAPHLQAWTAAKGGQLRLARSFSRRAVELAAQRNLKEPAASSVAERMLDEASCGLCQQVRQDAAQALAVSRVGFVTSEGIIPVLPGVALALALCGEIGEAQQLAEELAQRYQKATQVNAVSLPVTRAALELHRGQADQAVQLLEAVTQYEGRAWLWPTYLRGQAYLRLNQSAPAAAEFQKILDHPGWAYPSSTFYALAPLGLARAAAMSGDVARSRKAYEDFFAQWKAADADLPVLVEAKKEYDRLLRNH